MNRLHLARWLAGLALLITAPAVPAAACTSAAPACTEWIAMEGPLGTQVYRSHALGTRNEGVTRALVIIHGGSRDAHNQFRHALAAAFLAGTLEDTVIVSPRFGSNEEGIPRESLGENAVA